MDTPSPGTAHADPSLTSPTPDQSLLDELCVAAPQLSRECAQLTLFALGHALESLAPGTDVAPMSPFSMVASPIGLRLARYAGGYEECLAAVRDAVRISGGLRAVVASDVYVTGDGQRHDAIVVEACDAGGVTVLIAQRYARQLHDVLPVGYPTIIGGGGGLL